MIEKKIRKNNQRNTSYKNKKVGEHTWHCICIGLFVIGYMHNLQQKLKLKKDCRILGNFQNLDSS